MSVRFSEEQVLKATGAQRTRIGARASYSAVCTDTRQLLPGCLFVALKGEKYDANDFLFQAAEGGAAGVVVNAGRELKLPGPEVAVYVVPDTLVALGQLGRAHRERFKKPVAAITGSNGKTTTKELTAAILNIRGAALKTDGNLNNEVGVPLTLFRLEPHHAAAVVEMGMNHAGEIARMMNIARPDAGLITVVQPAHLQGLGSIEGVANAKGELFAGLLPGATAVVNLDDARVVDQAKRLKPGVKTLTYGRAAKAEVRLNRVESQGREGLSLVIETGGREWPIALNLIGDHNAMNAAGAFALAMAVGYSPDECVRGLEAAQAHARRLEILDAPGGVTVVDDCYNANPASMQAALDALGGLAVEGKPIAVLGDMLELGPDELEEHRRMGTRASESAHFVAFFGERMKAGHEMAARKLKDRTAHFSEIEPLVTWLKERMKHGDVVLVKGSRGMKLERVVDALTGRSTSKGGH